MKKTALFLTTLSLAVIAQDSASSEATVEAFFSNPQVDKCSLSPDGKTLAMLSTHEGFLNIHVLDIAKGNVVPVTREKFDVVDFFWSGNDYLVYSNTVLENAGKLERIPSQLFSIGKGGENRKPLAFRLSKESSNVVFPELIHRLADDPQHVVVSLRLQIGGVPDVFKLNIITGQLEQILANPGSIQKFITDEKGNPRFGFSFELDGSHACFYRPANSDTWQPFLGKLTDLEYFKPVAIASSKDIGVAASNLSRDKTGLFKVHYKDGLISKTPTLSHHSCDVDADAIYSYGSGGFVGVGYEELKPKQMFFDTNFRNLHEFIDKRVPNAFNRVISHNEQGSILVLESISAKRPIEYYRVTLEDGLNVKLIAQSRPGLAGASLRGSTAASFRASDGQLVQVYLTLPESYVQNEPVPMVVIPHDGPWSRDTWGFRTWQDFIPEYYADKGFAVLQVNYRGSTGFGKQHMQSSFKNLDRMHQDVFEGIQWAIEKGYADRNRIGISGLGWGGYMAVSAMTRWPELFKFGVAMEGIFNLESYIRGMPAWATKLELQNWKNRVGNPVLPMDQANLRKWSPIYQASTIKAPLFVYHGARGDRVDYSQSKALVDALNTSGLPNRFVQQPDRTLPSFNQSARIGLFNQLDSFLNSVTRSW